MLAPDFLSMMFLLTSFLSIQKLLFGKVTWKKEEESHFSPFIFPSHRTKYCFSCLHSLFLSGSPSALPCWLCALGNFLSLWLPAELAKRRHCQEQEDGRSFISSFCLQFLADTVSVYISYGRIFFQGSSFSKGCCIASLSLQQAQKW